MMKQFGRRLGWPLFLCAGVLMLGGCTRYGPTSAAGYQYATALYSVCNLEDAERLKRLREMVEADRDAEKITPQEARWVGAILDQAAAGDWETAKRKSRKLMEDQLGRE